MGRVALKLAALYSRVRQDEKLIFAALDRRGVAYEKVDDRTLVFDLTAPARQWDFRS